MTRSGTATILINNMQIDSDVYTCADVYAKYIQESQNNWNNRGAAAMFVVQTKEDDIFRNLLLRTTNKAAMTSPRIKQGE